MVNHENVKKYGTDKIFLLALFALSLLIAYWIVQARKAIILGDPKEIPELGISVRLPSGNGWQCDENWQNQENTLIIRSSFQPNPSLTVAQVVFTYRPASARQSARQWLQDRTGEVGADNANWGSQQTQTGNMEWVHISGLNHISGMLLATAPIGQGRWLDVEITHLAEEQGLSLRIFEKLAEHISAIKSELLEKGIRAVKELKAAGLSRYTHGGPQPYYYLIKNASGRDVGFAVDIMLESENADGYSIQASSFAYIRSPSYFETATFFQSDDNLDNARWESETKHSRDVLTIRGRRSLGSRQELVRSTSRVTISDGNKMSVHRLGSDSTQFETLLSEASIPSAAVEHLYFWMIEAGTDKMVVDIVFSDGRIKPAVVSRQKTPADEPEAEHLIKVGYLGGDDYDEIYINGRGRIVKQILKQKNIFVLLPSELDELTRRFPERADYILQRSRAVKKGKL